MKRRLSWFALAAFVAYGSLLYVAPLFFSLPQNLEEGPPHGLLFADRNGHPIRRMLDGDLRAADPASYREFSQALIQATIAAEDSRFFRHNGIDYLGTLRAIRDAVTKRRFVSGASTITQQTVKLYSPPRRRSFQTKILEIFTSRKLEMFADKETILTAYLNRLPYGNQYTGAKAAAQGYFGKPLGDLSLAEAALLAGLPNKPTRLNPWKNLEGARKRQFWILGRMKEEGVISEADFSSALVETLKFLPGPAQTFHAPHFVELAVSQEASAVEKAKAEKQPVQTTLDLSLQEFVESTVSAELARLGHQSQEASDLHAAVVVIENSTGDVLALTGSRSFFGSKSGQVNGAWTPRSAGSTLKPFTYLLGLERGFTAASVLADTPIEYITSTGTYQPVNFDRQFHGPVSVRRALANSLNVPAVKLLDQIGGPLLLHETLSSDLKFSSLDDNASEYGLGLTLGNAEVRLLEMTNGYACLARLGSYQPYRLIRSDSNPPSRQVFHPESAWLIADILSDRKARVEAFGLNSPLNLPFQTACKTGTSTDFRDNWTLGYTPDFTVGVWVGRFNNRPLNKVSGAMGAAPIFHRVMVHLHEDREPSWYSPPKNAVAFRIDPLNGKLPPPTLSFPAQRLRKEWFVNGNHPETASIDHYSNEALTLLPRTYHNWWSSEVNDLQEVAALAPIAKDDSPIPFRIVSPLEGTVAFLDPDLPGNGSRFPLEVAGSGTEEIDWESPSLKIESDGNLRWLILQPGEHDVIARDRKTGREIATHLIVRAL